MSDIPDFLKSFMSKPPNKLELLQQRMAKWIKLSKKETKEGFKSMLVADYLRIEKELRKE